VRHLDYNRNRNNYDYRSTMSILKTETRQLATTHGKEEFHQQR